MIVDDADFPEQAGERCSSRARAAIKADDPQVTAAVRDVVSRLERHRGRHARSRARSSAADRANTVSKDGRSVRRELQAARQDRRPRRAREARRRAPLAAVAAVQQAHPELRVEQFGDASAAKALGAAGRAGQARGRCSSPRPAC